MDATGPHSRSCSPPRVVQQPRSRRAAYRLRALTARGAWAAAGVRHDPLRRRRMAVGRPGRRVLFTSPRSHGSSPSGRDGESRSRDRAGRDWTQVVANGGAAAITALAYGLTGSPLCLVAGAGAVAVATADTWATEIGRFSRTEPRILATWRRAPHGASGGVTGVGLLGACAGAVLIALIGAPRLQPRLRRVWQPPSRSRASPDRSSTVSSGRRSSSVALDQQQRCELRGHCVGSDRGGGAHPLTQTRRPSEALGAEPNSTSYLMRPSHVRRHNLHHISTTSP